MATTTELENIVIRLSADVEGLLKGMGQVKDSVSNMEKQVVGAFEHIEKLKGGLQELGATIASVFGGESILAFLKESKEEWFAAETAVFELNAVLKANGREVEDLSGRYQDFATAVQKNTVYSDEYVLGLVKMTEQYGMTGREAEKATERVLQFSKATGSGDTMALRVVKAMQEGDVEMAMMMSKRLGPFKRVKDEEEFKRIYERTLGQGREMLEGETKTGAGKRKNFENQFSDMQEEIGKIFTKVDDPIKKLKKTAMELFNGFSEETKKAIVLTVGWGAQLLVVSGTLLTIGKLAPMIGLTWTNLKGLVLAAATNPVFWIAAATIAFVTYRNEILMSTEALNKHKKEVESLNEHFDRSNSRYANEIKSRIDSASGSANLEKLKALKEEIDKDIEYQQAILDATGRPMWIERQFNGPEAERNEAGYQGQVRALAARKAAKRMIDEAMDNIDNSQKVAANEDKYGNLVRNLEKQNRELGKSAEELELIKIQATLTFEQVGNVYAKIATLDFNRKADEARKGAASFIKEMDLAVKARAAKKGEDWFFNDQLEKFSEHLSKSELDIARWANRMDVIGKEVEAQEEKTATPLEKFEKEQRRLYELLVEGAGRWDLYEKAVDEAAKSLHEAAAAARDAAGAGSAEGMARLIEYSQGTGARTWNVGKPVMKPKPPQPEVGPMPREVGSGGILGRGIDMMVDLLTKIEKNTNKNGNDIIFGEMGLQG